MALGPKSQIQQHLPTQESLLLDYVQRLDKHRKGRRAVHIHLSGLLPHNRREHHVRIAANTFDSLVKMLHGQIFTLSNTDLMFVFKVACLDAVEAAIVKLRFLFSDDPLLAEDGPSRAASAFATWYDLERDYDKLLLLAKDLTAIERQKRSAETAPPQGERIRQDGGEPMTPDLLARCEAALAQADLSNLMRRQSVCAIVGNAAPEPVFNELFISINDLRQTLLPNVNMASSRWLFQQLTETLDRRVLSLLNKHDDRTVAGDISINLNVATLLSPEFLTFDDNVKSAMRGTIVLELQKIDIFADVGAYLFARDFAHERGYRICIDGLNHLALPFVNRERLGADMIKIVWEPSILETGAALGELVKRAGPSRVILCRCDSQQAIEYGQSVGITLFQGRHVESLLMNEIRRRKLGYVRRR